MDIHGIIFDDDYQGNTFDVAGCDISKCGVVFGPCDDRDRFIVPAGLVIEVRRVMGAVDCRSDADRGLLDLNRGRPFIRASAQLVEKWLPGAEALVTSRALRWGGEGSVLERSADGHISRSQIRIIRLGTPTALAPKFRVFPGLG